MNRTLSAFLILCIMSILAIIHPAGCSPDVSAPNTFQVKSQIVDHEPILIGNDSDFQTQDWPGSGTHGDPYRIEDVRIASTSCILIGNTSVYFLILNCVLINSNESYWHATGIEFENVTHGLVEFCNITGFGEGYTTGRGIMLTDSNYCDLVRNTITDCGLGIGILRSNHTLIEDNIVEADWSCINSGVEPISTDVIVKGNLFTEKYFEDGIDLMLSGSNWQFENNVFGGAGYSMSSTYIMLFNSQIINNDISKLNVELRYCEKVVVSSNSITDAVYYGLNLIWCSEISVIHNVFEGSFTGLGLARTNHCIIYNNTFDNYDENAHDERGFNNIWDDGISLGNVWSDYNGSTEVYEIPGSSGSIDRYPRMLATGNGMSISSEIPIIMGIVGVVVGVVLLILKRRRG
ncbi:MAG: NosD domain-containing protein [Candidatus Thorarchaeota archaeon]